jgi:hypothetical protein
MVPKLRYEYLSVIGSGSKNTFRISINMNYGALNPHARYENWICQLDAHCYNRTYKIHKV